MAKNLISDPTDFIPRIKVDLDRSICLIGGFFLLIIFLKLGLKISLAKEIFLLLLLLLLAAGLLILFFRRLGEREPERAIGLHFGYNIFQMVLLTIIIYYTGSITWVTPIFYSFTIINAFWIYPRNLAVLMLSWCNALLVSLVALQHFQILPGFYIFQPEGKNFQNLPYVLLTTIAALTALFFIGFFSNTFYTLLDNKIKDLKKAKEGLEGAKKLLEAEIQKRTKESAEEKRRLEEEAKRRTKELEEERKIVQEKVREMEESHKITVARELKMIKLKGEIAKLKKRESKL
jgi:hypothetical protein